MLAQGADINSRRCQQKDSPLLVPALAKDRLSHRLVARECDNLWGRRFQHWIKRAVKQACTDDLAAFEPRRPVFDLAAIEDGVNLSAGVGKEMVAQCAQQRIGRHALAC
ncbi:hypothetical protein D3C85_1634020 [compost metagenome]